MNKFRKKRFELFYQLMGINKYTTILDVGGLPYDWIDLKFKGQVICCSLSNIPEGEYGDGNVLYLKQDATSLPYSDNFFDVVYSNSLLEHVGKESQYKVAYEIQRCGTRCWVQVPDRNFPLEPHYYALFFYQMPLSLKKLTAKFWSSKILGKSSYLNEVETIWPLTYNEMAKLFPSSNIIREKFCGLTKSLIAVIK